MKDSETELHTNDSQSREEEGEIVEPAAGEDRTRTSSDNAEQSAPAPFFDKKRKIRLLVCIIAAIINVVFIILSYNYFSELMGSYVFTITAIVIVVATAAVIILASIALFRNWETTFKLSITVLYIEAIFLIVYYLLNRSGFLASVNSADDVYNYINNSGGVAEIIFILANFLQVTIIPIPSTITTTAGALLFEGIWKPLYLTVIGLVVGSMFAFFLGRVFGVRFANWLVGEKTIAKYKAMTKGRDKIVLFYMFLFPFFPDDFLCILAGMTNYTYLGFFLLQVFSRTIGTLVTILMTKGILSIPMHGWWIALWVVIIALVIILFVYTIKYSEKIENFIMKIIDKLTFGLIKKKKEKEVTAEGDVENAVNKMTDSREGPVESNVSTEQGDKK